MPGMEVLFLSVAAFFAGLVDSVAGGGGLISLPALLIAGVPPHLALGTNKVQSCLGTMTGTLRYLKSGQLHLPIATCAASGALVGSPIGARLALAVSGRALARAVPFLVLAVGLLTFLRPSFGGHDRFRGVNGRRLAGAGLLGAAVGCYDGFFGPGTGTFLAFFFVLFFGFDFLRATANAKLTNLASNLSAVVAFGLAGAIDWPLALPMATANIVGNWLGAGLAIRRGAPMIKPIFGLVLAGLLLKLLFFS